MVQETVVEGLDESSDFVKEPAVPKKTIYVGRLSDETEISDIIDFFKDVGQVVRVRLLLTRKDTYVPNGFVEFVSADEAKKALEKKKSEYLLDRRIFLDVVNKGGRCLPPKRVSMWAMALLSLLLLTKQSGIDFFKDVGKVVHVRLIVDPKVKHVGFGFVEFASANDVKKALEKKNGDYLHDCQILLDVLKTASYPLRPKIFIFKNVGQVVGVRLVVDHRGEHVGCGFVEFASADEAKKAVQEKNGSSMYVNMAEIAPYPFRPKYEDYLRREGFGLDNKPNLEKPMAFCGKKITFSDED
ncbi:unnamed protein product [Thlaspi arvense]|uniref:RRM domain-containing protein n=1 Tax=Thlaspi arvense TaxID=13288 RepID=A0AAU9SMA1_THLAR|nr:unnamed protein product [Thlaspi arvense]